MFRIATVFFFLFVGFYAHGQDVKIVDQHFKEVPFCDIYSVDELEFFQSDENGKIDINSFQEDVQYVFSTLGFEEDTLSRKELEALKNHTLTLISDECVIKDVIVTAPSRKKQKLSAIPSKVDVITQEKIYEYGSQTSADILSQSNEVFVQKSQLGGGSPVIRGFEASRVLLVMDGVRLNNAIYRSGHLQNSITLDPLILDRAEVIFGPSAVTYGNDALGGVVHYFTKDPKFANGEKTEYKSNVYLKYSSANFEKRIHGDLEVRKKKWAFLTSASLSDFEDLRAGQNGLSEYGDFAERPDFVSSFEGRDTVLQNDERPHVQVGTGYSQYDFLQKIRFALNDSTYFKANVNYSTSSNVPRYDRLIERQGGQLKFAEWDYGPQNRLLASLNTQLYRNKSLYSKANILLAYQRIDEDRIRRKFGSTIRSTQEEDVHVISLNADFNKFYTEKKHSVLNYGLELKHDIVNSNAFDIDLSVDEENRIRNEDVLTRYPDGGSTLSTGSLYANSDWNLGKNQRILVGARYTQVFIRSNFTNELFELPFDEVDLSIGALTGSIGYVGEFNNGWNIRSSVSSAFRAPNVDDFGKVRAKSGNVTVPNDELSSEQAVSFDFGISKTFFKQFRVTGNAFYTSLYDAIVRDTFSLPNGDTTLFIDGAFNRITTNVNTGVANIWGGNIDVEIKVYKEWSAKGSVTYTRGRNVSDDQPLAHIPPTYGGFDLTYKKGAIRTTLAIQFNDTKAIEDFDPSPDSPDNLELATEDGTPAWWVLNWYGTVKVAPKVAIHFGVENIFDRRYRPFSSGISGPGRNVQMALHTTF